MDCINWSINRWNRINQSIIIEEDRQKRDKRMTKQEVKIRVKERRANMKMRELREEHWKGGGTEMKYTLNIVPLPPFSIFRT